MLSALQQTALAYLARDVSAIPLWSMVTTPLEELRARAASLGVGTVVELTAVAGGGSLPGIEIPSVGVAIEGDHLAALRREDTPVIATVRDHTTLADLRTVDPSDDGRLAAALVRATHA